jgi:hypothetical protein
MEPIDPNQVEGIVLKEFGSLVQNNNQDSENTNDNSLEEYGIKSKVGNNIYYIEIVYGLVPTNVSRFLLSEMIEEGSKIKFHIKYDGTEKFDKVGDNIYAGKIHHDRIKVIHKQVDSLEGGIR